MKIVKLDAIDSTNSYLKGLVRENALENWTVVVANFQTQGRGQLDNVWQSKKGKNLTFSILIQFETLHVMHQFYLNYAISIALFNVLKYYIPEKLTVKWPNDIMSGNQKICGILIESTIKKSNVKNAIIGIGLNVNQDVFPVEVVKATSLKKVLNIFIDKEELLDKILLEIQYQALLIEQGKFEEIKQEYEAVLYKKGVPSMFINSNNHTFLGKIIGISLSGNLQIELDDESIQEFRLKEIKFA